MPRLLDLVLLGFLSPAAAGAAQPPETEAPATLRQVVADGQVLFYDAGFESLFITEKTFSAGVGIFGGREFKTRRLSNVLVRAIAPRAGYPGLIESVPGVSTWLDLRGHIHSLAVLDDQRAFNRRLIEARGDCADTGCELKAHRARPLAARVIPLTGILDRETLRIPLLDLELRYDTAAARLEAECSLRGPSGCQAPPWPNAVMARWAEDLLEARKLLDRYDSLLSSTPLRSPRPLGWLRSYSRTIAGGESGGGLEGLLPPGVSDAYSYFKRHEYFVLEPKGDEPETLTPLAVDATAFGADLLGEVESARLRAAEALHDVERFAEAAGENWETRP